MPRVRALHVSRRKPDADPPRLGELLGVQLEFDRLSLEKIPVEWLAILPVIDLDFDREIVRHEVLVVERKRPIEIALLSRPRAAGHLKLDQAIGQIDATREVRRETLRTKLSPFPGCQLPSAGPVPTITTSVPSGTDGTLTSKVSRGIPQCRPVPRPSKVRTRPARRPFRLMALCFRRSLLILRLMKPPGNGSSSPWCAPVFCSPRPRRADIQYVIAISIDGLRGDFLKTFVETAPTEFPNFVRLRNQSAFTFNARCDYTDSITIPDHLCMLTGRPSRLRRACPRLRRMA